MTEPKILKTAAVFGQLLALFPFAVLMCGAGINRYEPWIYAVIYAVWGGFYIAGRFFGGLAGELSGRFPKKAQPVILFLSRAAAIIPVGIFIFAVIAGGITSAAFFYVLPGGIIAYFGAHGCTGKGYSDVFSRGWFALYFGAAVIAAVMLWSTHDGELAANGIFQLCIGFALIILLSALLANQTNIDVCTKQRAGGKSVLPEGLRRYNAVLITVICTVTIGLFLFARPLAGLVKLLISLIGRAVLFVFQSLGSCVQTAPDDGMSDPGQDNISDIFPSEPANPLANAALALLMIGMLVVAFLLRKQIWSALKSIFEPLFRRNKEASDIPFYDEILVSDAKKLSPRARRRAERELVRQYKRENDPARRYRLGYALFLVRLGKTDKPPVPADTTTIHREKGENAFEIDLGEFSGVYERVRYGETAPTADELARQEQILIALK